MLIQVHLGSGKESGISSSYLLVGVSNGGEHPLGKHSLGSIGTEEVIENRGVKWLNGRVAEIIIISLDLWAPVIKRVADELLNQFAVYLAEHLKRVACFSKHALLGSDLVPLELLLLIS